MMDLKGKPSVSNNYIMNLLVNIFTMLVPLITTPYISRALGSESIGIYSYCLSIETYFVVIGTLGIPTYAKREIASARENHAKLNQIYSELLTMQAVMLSLAIALYAFVTIVVNTKYRLMFAMCGIGIVAALFDVSWLFLGLENFKIIVTRSVVFKAICVALIFLFVKKADDLYIYALSLMLANLFCNVWLLVTSRKYVRYSFPGFGRILKHIKPAFFLLLPSMVTTIYAVIDKTMLGMISGNMSEVGFYEQSQKIVTLSLTLITSLGAVLMPRLAALFSEGNQADFHKYINKGISAICFVSLPLAVGCFVVSDNLVPWFYGSGYDKIALLLKVFAPMLFFMGLSDLIGVQAFVAIHKEKQLLIINIFSTVVNLALNALLIPKYLAYGAAFATMLSELVKCAVFIACGRSYLEIKAFFQTMAKYFIVSLIMGGVVWCVQLRWLNDSSIINTMLLIVLGAISYGGVLLITKDDWIMKSINFVQVFIGKLSKRKQ